MCVCVCVYVVYFRAPLPVLLIRRQLLLEPPARFSLGLEANVAFSLSRGQKAREGTAHRRSSPTFGLRIPGSQIPGD
jgi:hypothetical protein